MRVGGRHPRYGHPWARRFTSEVVVTFVEEIAGISVEVRDGPHATDMADRLVVLRSPKVIINPVAVHALVLAHRRTADGAVKGFVPTMLSHLPPGATYEGMAEHAALRSDHVEMNELADRAPVALLRPGTRYQLDGDEVEVSEGSLARVPGALALDPLAVEHGWGDAEPAALRPYKRAPLVFALATGPGAEGQRWLEQVAPHLRTNGLDVRLAAGEGTVDNVWSRDASVAPCRASPASIRNLRPDVILALDEGAVSLGGSVTADWRRTRIVRYDPTSSGLEVLTETAHRDDRIAAVIGAGGTPDGVASLLTRVAAGPHVRGPRITPTDVRPGRRIQHRERGEHGGGRVSTLDVGMLVARPDDPLVRARLGPVQDQVEALGGSVEFCDLRRDSAADVPVLIANGFPASSDVAGLLELRAGRGHVTFLDLFGVDLSDGASATTWGSWCDLRERWIGLAPTRAALGIAGRADVPALPLPVLAPDDVPDAAEDRLEVTIVVSPWAPTEDVDRLRRTVEMPGEEFVDELKVRVHDGSGRWGGTRSSTEPHGFPSLAQVVGSRALIVVGAAGERFSSDAVSLVAWTWGATTRTPTLITGSGAPDVFQDGRDAFLGTGDARADLQRLLWDARERADLAQSARARVRTLAEGTRGRTYVRRILSASTWRGDR